MEVWLLDRFKRLGILQQLLIIGFAFLGTTAVALGDNNEHYSIVEEHQTCDQIIPKFIKQVMNHEISKCDESGVFPQPGNCTVFFKCVQSGSTIQPLIEYCASGYNFVQGVCVPHGNSSECPQFTCRIPDATHAIGNEVEVNDESKGNDFQSLPLIVPPSSSPATIESSTTDISINESLILNSSSNTVMIAQPDQGLHTQQSMHMTQPKENSSESIQSTSITCLFTIVYFLFICTN